MSERYGCVLVVGSRGGGGIPAFEALRSPLPIGLGELDPDLSAVYVTSGRLFRPLEVGEVAVALSARFGRALLLLYDNSCDVTVAAGRKRGQEPFLTGLG